MATPIVVTHLGFMMLGVVDTMMVGRLGAGALAAVGLGVLFAWGLNNFGMGLLCGVVPIAAQAWGARDQVVVGATLKRGLVLSLLVSVPNVVLFQLAEPILLALGQPGELSHVAGAFVRPLALELPPWFAFVVIKQVLQSMGVVRPALLAVLAGNLANLAGDYAFIYGHWGASAHGVIGSAWASVLARWLMLLVLCVLGAPALSGVWRASVGQRLFALGHYLKIVRVGFPIGLQLSFELGAFHAAGFLMGWLGPLPLAGHQVAATLASVSGMVPVAIAQAATTRIGNAIGREQADGVRMAAAAALTLAGGVMVVFAAVFELFPEALVRVFTDDRGVLIVAVPLVAIAGLFQIFDGLGQVSAGILRGAADTRAAATANFVGYWILGLPCGAALAFGAHAGPRGMWLGLTLALALVAILLVGRVVRRHILR